jgi:hypothetical protein
MFRECIGYPLRQCLNQSFNIIHVIEYGWRDPEVKLRDRYRDFRGIEPVA